jgi:oligopeptidase B
MQYKRSKRFLIFAFAKQMLPDQIENTEFSLEWANDNKTVFYTTMDDTNRPDTVWKHVIGTNPEDDVEVYHGALLYSKPHSLFG